MSLFHLQQLSAISYKHRLILLFFMCSIYAQGQVSIAPGNNPPDSSAILDVQGSNKGMLIPRMSSAQRNLISEPATGLLVYQTDGQDGFYFYNGSNWLALNSRSNPGHELSDSDEDTKIQVEATSDEDKIRFDIEGLDAMIIDTNSNVGIGTSAPAASAKLEISSNTQGFLPPRMSRAQRNAIVNPELGLIIFCTNCPGGKLQSFNGTQWTALEKGATSYGRQGSDIDGEADSDQSGTNALSSDGLVVAIGARENDGNGDGAGHVRVYQWSGTAWVQQGDDIDGEAASDQSGGSVSLSADGSIVAIGAIGNGDGAGHVRVYQWSGSSWEQLGGDIDGEPLSISGASVSLSSDGHIVAIGAPLADGFAGHVSIYQWSGTAWVQQGDDIDGEAASDQSGNSVSLSGDGTSVAIGALGNDGNGDGAGHVRIHQWNGTAWVKQGDDIDGEAAGDQSGGSVSLSGDGTSVAIGAEQNDENGDGAGHVRIYQWSGTAWVQQGDDIDGEAAGDKGGGSVSLSADGSIVVVGAPSFNSNQGHTRIFKLNGSEWIQQGEDLYGEAGGDFSGSSVAMSSDGSILVVGAYGNAGNGNDRGHVRAYELSGGVPWSSFSNIPPGFADGVDSVATWFTLEGIPDGFADNVDNVDNLGNHIATTNLNMNGHDIKDVDHLIIEDHLNQSNPNAGTLMFQQLVIYHPDSPLYKWSIGHQEDDPSSGDDDLYFYVQRGLSQYPEANVAGFVQDNEAGTQMNFTGQHRCLVLDVDYTDPDILNNYQGLIVVADQNQYLGMSGGLQMGNEAIMIDEALPLVSLSIQAKDKRVFGVISTVESEDRHDEAGAFATPYIKENGDERMYINSVGEGGIWIVDQGGIIESGDYIQSSSVPGYGMIQADNLVHNYTVAKITMDCDFKPNMITKKRIKKLPKSTSKEKSNVNATDIYGAIIWETDTEENGTPIMEKEYEIRYLKQDGTQISLEEYIQLKRHGLAAYRAAFVGCTYHCG